MDLNVVLARVADPDPEYGNLFILDPGWEKIGSGIRKKYPGSVISFLLVYSTDNVVYYCAFVTNAPFSTQASISNIEFDFLNYGIQRFREYRRRKAILEF